MAASSPARQAAFLLPFAAGLVYQVAQAIVVGVSFVAKYITVKTFVDRRGAAGTRP